MAQQPHIQRLETQDAAGRKVVFSVGTEIMDYVETGRAFGAGDLPDEHAFGPFQSRVVALPDRRSGAACPMVLTVGNDNRLALVRRADGTSTAWDRIDLHPRLKPEGAAPNSGEPAAAGPAGRVTAFGAAWFDQDGQDVVTLAVAVADQEKPGRSRIFVACDLSIGGTDWSRLDWTDCGCRGDLKVDAIRITRDVGGVWSIVLAASQAFRENVYLVRSDRLKEGGFAQDALVFSTPVDLSRITDFQLGPFDDGCALYVQGADLDGKPVLVMRPVPAFDQDGEVTVVPSAYDLPCPTGAHVLALGRCHDPDWGSDVFVGGDGVHLARARDVGLQTQAALAPVLEPALAARVKRLLVAENDDGAVTLWALLDSGHLVTRHRGAADAPWQPPLCLRRGVAEVAPVEGDDHVTTSLIVVYDDHRAAHLWRDAQGIWQELDICVSEGQETVATPCYATTVCVMDAHGAPCAGVDVEIRSSIVASLVINGQVHQVGPQLPAKVQTQVTGVVSIYDRAVSFSPARHCLGVAGVPRQLEINPAASLYKRLEGMTADELRQAMLPGHAGPLLDPELRGGPQAGSVDSFVEAMKQASTLARGMSGNAAGARLVEAGKAFAPDDPKPRQDVKGPLFGVSCNAQGQIQPLPAAQAQALAARPPQEKGFWASLGDSISDLFEGVWSGVKGVVEFVVTTAEKGYRLVCSIANEVKNFVLSTLEEIGGFFKWAWDKLKGAAKKAWQYLKFLFDWEDIKAGRDSLADLVIRQLDQLRAQVGSLKPVIANQVHELRRAVQQIGKEFGLRTPRDVMALPDTGKKAVAADESSPANSLLGSGPGAWICERLQNLASEVIEIKLPEHDLGPDPLASLMDKQLELLRSLGRELGEDFNDIFGEEGFSILNLDVEKLFKLVLAVLVRVADKAVQAVGNVLIALVECLESMLGFFRDVLLATVRFPFIERLVRLVSNQHIDTSFRVIDAVLLPTAVLTTIAYKIVNGAAPLQDVLTTRLPVAGGVAGQSFSGFVEYAAYFKNLASTIAGTLSILVGAPAALKGDLKVKPTLNVSFIGLGLSLGAYVLGNGAALVVSTFKTNKSALGPVAIVLLLLLGLGRYVLRYRHMRWTAKPQARFPKTELAALPSQESYTAGTKSTAMTMVALYVLEMVVMLGSYAASEDRDTDALLQYLGQAAPEAALQSCQLVSNIKVRAGVVIGAIGANVYLNLVKGGIRHTEKLEKNLQRLAREDMRLA